MLGVALEPLTRALSALATYFADLPGSQIASAAVIAHRGRRCLRRPRAPWWPAPPGVAARTDTARAPIAAAMAAPPGGPARRRSSSESRWRARCSFARTTAPPAPPGQLTVSFLDVGQGDATLIQHPDGGAVLFDGGPPEGRVARLLRAAGVRRLSAVVMTHASRDHQGGLAEVIDRYPVDLLVDGGDGTADPTSARPWRPPASAGSAGSRAIAPMDLAVGGLDIRILAPAARPPGPAAGGSRTRARWSRSSAPAASTCSSQPMPRALRSRPSSYPTWTR